MAARDCLCLCLCLSGARSRPSKARGSSSCGETGACKLPMGIFWAGPAEDGQGLALDRKRGQGCCFLAHPKHLRCSFVVIFSPPRTHPPCTPVTCRSRRFNTVTIFKMFMASRIQTRAFSASARNVSKKDPALSYPTNHAGIGASVHRCASAHQCPQVPAAAGRATDCPARPGQQWPAMALTMALTMATTRTTTTTCIC